MVAELALSIAGDPLQIPPPVQEIVWLLDTRVPTANSRPFSTLYQERALGIQRLVLRLE